MQDDFQLPKLLHMDEAYFSKRIWPHMFYMSAGDIWRWKMNVARAMGNTLDERCLADLVKVFKDNSDYRIRGMAAWAIGRIGGLVAKTALQSLLPEADQRVEAEIIRALNQCMSSVHIS